MANANQWQWPVYLAMPLIGHLIIACTCKVINCTEIYLKLYSHYPENAANSHTVFTFSSSSSLWRYRCASRATFFSPLSSELCIEVIHPFCIDKARKRGCIEHPCCKSQFRNALTLHYNHFGDILLPRVTYFTNGEFIVFPHILIGGSSQRNLSAYCAQCNAYLVLCAQK